MDDLMSVNYGKQVMHRGAFQKTLHRKSERMGETDCY